jgi:NAD(P)-dependent dehydrogenase (short-subunit alcohol dehydrogenase family)
VRIVNCSSVTGLEGSGQLHDYSATKGAINAFTKALAQNLVEKRQFASTPSRPARVWTPLNVAIKTLRRSQSMAPIRL